MKFFSFITLQYHLYFVVYLLYGVYLIVPLLPSKKIALLIKKFYRLASLFLMYCVLQGEIFFIVNWFAPLALFSYSRIIVWFLISSELCSLLLSVLRAVTWKSMILPPIVAVLHITLDGWET